ncbi:MAG TPA: hypothetical protein VK348_02700, partial [Planctomycetota bacterium]|nr:hypothetical protein [Planctomycetota bacterium]
IIVQPVPFPILYPNPSGIQITTQLEICSNGFISPAGTNGIGATPTVSGFLTGQPRWANWYNFDPALGGSVTFDVDPANTAVYVTWTGVPGGVLGGVSPGTGVNTFQMAFFATGDVEYRYQAMALGGGGSWPALVGWTPGNGALDRSLDLSVSFPFHTDPTDNPPLLATMSARPLLGTTPNIVTGNIPAGTALGARILSFVQQPAGIPLGAFGMPGCFQYTNLDVVTAFLTGGNSTVNTPFAIPNLPVLNNVLVFGQTATFSSGFNPLGVITSNGLRFVLGSL